MPRSLTFQFHNSSFEATLIKIDRSKIYGSVDIVTTDHEGADTDLFSLARDGRTLIGLGGTGSGYINKDGYWVETNERIAVDVEGDPMELIDSSFDAPIVLEQTVSEEMLTISNSPIAVVPWLILPLSSAIRMAIYGC